MSSDFLHGTIERIPLPQEANKSRSFSTSTPYVSVSGKDVRDKDLLVSVCSTTNDSGLGASLTDISVTSPLDAGQPTVTVTICTPRTNLNIPRLTGRNCFLSSSPVSSRKVRTRRSLESCFTRSFEDGDRETHSSGLYSFDDNDVDTSANSSGFTRLFDKNFVRRLNLDLDIYNCQEAKNSVVKESSSFSSKQNSLDEKFTSILAMHTPAEPDRLIGRKMGVDHVDIISELHSRSILCLSQILSYLDPEDLCR